MITHILKDNQEPAESVGVLNFSPETHSKKVACVTLIEQESKGTRCLNCGSSGINLVRMHEGCKHWAARRCSVCDCFIGWQPKPGNTVKRSQQQELISQLLESAQLTHWEKSFLESVRDRKKLSPKQVQALIQVESRVGGQA